MSGWLQADSDALAGRFGFSDETYGPSWFGSRCWHHAIVWKHSTYNLHRWTPGVLGVYDHDVQEWVRYGPTLQWDSGCHCLEVDIGVAGPDRPEAWLRLDLRPRRLKDSP